MTSMKKFPFVSLIALSIAMPALAQEAPAPAPQSAPPAEAEVASDVIVVTANKRQESVQDVAVAVTAVTSQMREELGIATVTDLTNMTPGLSYTAANERITLRGIGRNTNNFGADPGVANYTDGVYQAFATIAGRDNIFTDRIEVLRGPQGTLYGRNSIGGALNIVSKRPTDDFEGEFRMGAGDYDQMKIATSLSGPVTDWLRYRVVGYDESRDGIHWNNGTRSNEGYAIDNWNLEGQLEADLGENLTAWFKYTTGRYTMAGPPGGRTSTFSEAPYLKPFGSQATFTYNNAFVDGGVLPQGTYAFTGDSSVISYTQDGGYTENPFANGIKAFNSSAEGVADLDAYDDYAAELVYETPWGFDVKYVGGYIYYDYHLYGDNDDNPVRSITYNSIQAMTTAGPCAALIPSSGTFIPPINFPRSTIPAALQGCITASAPITIYPNWSSHYNETRSFFSNEVNFISTHDGPLQWIGGLYAYQENSQQPVETFLYDEPAANQRAIPGTALTLPNPGNRLTYTNNNGIFNAYGIYGQVDYQITDQFKLTGGLRYSYDLKQITETAQLNCYIICSATTGRTNRLTDITPFQWNGQRRILNTATPDPNDTIVDPRPQPGVVGATLANPTGVTYNAVTGLATRELKDNWDAVTGTAGVEWTPANDTLVFAKYSRGYKSGGFNATSMAPFPRTNKEIVDAYEAGWKQEWGFTNLTTNAALFLYDYKDVQVPVTVQVGTPGAVGSTTYTAFENIPKVETTGFELESTWRPIDDLTLRFTYAFLNAEIKESGQYVDALQTTASPNRVRDVEGNHLPQSPEHKVAVNAAYSFNFEDGSSLMPSVSWYWRDGFYSSIFNNPEQFTPDFAQTDMRLIWNDANGNFTVIGALRNAFDEEGYDNVSAGLRTANNTIYQTYTFTQPRMASVEVQFHF